MSPWLIYAWSQADRVREVLGASSAIMGIIGGMCAAFAASDGEAVPRWARNAVIAAALGGLVGLFVPSSRTIALMYVLPRVADSEAIQRDVPDLYRLAVDALKAELTDGFTEGGGR